MIGEKKTENVCFGQVLGTLYYHLQYALEDGREYNILSINVNEIEKTGTATIKIQDETQEWYFDSQTDIWVTKE